MEGFWDGACGNCIRAEKRAQCSLSKQFKTNEKFAETARAEQEKLKSNEVTTNSGRTSRAPQRFA
jgi:hypothetical protein